MHVGCGIAFAGHFIRWDSGLQLGNFSIIEIDVHRGGIFFEVFAALGSRDRNDVVALRENPGECELAGRDVFALGDFADAGDKRLVLVKIFGGEAWVTL